MNRNILLKSAVVAALLLPLLFAVSWNLAHTLFWFARAAVALVILLLLVNQLCSALRQQWARVLASLVLYEALALFVMARFISFYFQGESFNQRFFYHAELNSLREAWSGFPALLLGTLAYLLLVPVFAWFAQRQSVANPRSGSLVLHGGGLLLVLVLEPDLHSALGAGLRSGTVPDSSLTSIDWVQTGLHPEALEPQLDGITPGRNLVLIYLESLEKIYTEESIFPGLTPFLSSLKTTSLYFSDLQQTEGASWTVAGILASHCGTPLLSTLAPGRNDILQNEFLNAATCLGDLLQAAGYRQTFVGGASTRFAGKGTFLRGHGYDEVLGFDELHASINDPAYFNNWGLYDDSMFGIATRKFIELAEAGEPFNLTLLTVDTHHPAGTPSASCAPYPAIDNSILHAVHCSDQLLARFISTLQQHPAWQDTVVVLMSDHLAMRNIAQDLYPADYPRELFLAVLNAGESQEIPLPASHMDVAPTLLSLLDVQHQQVFLAGDNLLAPATAGRSVDFTNPERLEAIKYINYNLYTRSARKLCNNAALLSVQDNNLRLGGNETYLGIGGLPIAPENLTNTHSWLALIDNEGVIQSSMVVNTGNLPFILYQARQYHYLLVTSTASAAQLLPGFTTPPENKVAVLFGHQQGSTQILAVSEQVEGLQLAPDCDQMLAQSISAVEPERVFLLADFCRTPDKSPEVILDEAAGRLTFTRVAVANSWYSAVLQRQANGEYQIVEQILQGPVVVSDSPDYCHAYYSRSEVLIPLAQTNQGHSSLQLQLVSGSNDRFRITEQLPR